MHPRAVITLALVLAASISATLFTACGSDSTQTDWVLREEPAGDTLHLTVAIGGSCDSFDRIDVAESEELVTIDAYFKHSGSDCDAPLNWEPHEVKLAQPLGDRKLEGCDSPRPARDGASPAATRFTDCSSVVGLAPGDSRAACGPWSSADSALGTAIAQQYGEMSSCNVLAAGYSVITTLGRAPGETENQGVVGIYQCDSGDEECLRGTAEHPYSGWEFVTPPYSGGVTVLAHPTTFVLILDNGGKQLMFNVETGEFGESTAQPMPSN